MSNIGGAYVKTDLLQPGQSSTYTSSFDWEDISSYDAKTEEAWVLEAGTYTVSLGRSVRDDRSSTDLERTQRMVYRTDSVTGAVIENRFEDATYAGFQTLSRAGGNKDNNPTYPTEPQSSQTAPVDFSDIDEVIIPDTTGQTAATIGAVYDNPITLQQVALDPTLEDAFLDQLTLNEMIELIADCGFHTAGVPRLGIPETQDNDGPACVKGEGGLLYSSCGVAWPAGTCLACTWNDVLAYQMGVCCGMEAVNVGTDIWYSPTANLHRNPCGGRNFEYYSEDPLLCGNMATQVALGAQSQGVIVTVKHLVLNEQETNRWGIITWAEEQTIREIYLRPFEQVIKEGKSIGVMSAYNRLGKTWCGANSVLLNELLRGEWGFDGYVITDFSVYKLTLSEYMSPVLAIYARNDCVLSGIWIVQKPAITSKLKEQYNADPVGFGIAMRECCRDLIHMKMKSLAFQTQIVTPSAIRVEGETATVTGKPNKGSTFVEATDAASQGYTLANLSKKGNVATWTVNAIEAGEYQLTMNLASTHLLGFDTQLADHITLSVNGQNLDLSGITIEGDGVLTFNVYHTYGPISAYLNAGTNTVVLTVIGSDVPNIDCMDFIKAE